MTKVRIEHIRAANLCMGGSRRWFQSHGFSWATFLLEGVPVEELEATGDALALDVCAIARKEAADGRR